MFNRIPTLAGGVPKSIGVFNTEQDISAAIDAIGEIARHARQLGAARRA